MTCRTPAAVAVLVALASCGAGPKQAGPATTVSRPAAAAVPPICGDIQHDPAIALAGRDTAAAAVARLRSPATPTGTATIRRVDARSVVVRVEAGDRRDVYLVRRSAPSDLWGVWRRSTATGAGCPAVDAEFGLPGEPLPGALVPTGPSCMVGRSIDDAGQGTPTLAAATRRLRAAADFLQVRRVSRTHATVFRRTGPRLEILGLERSERGWITQGGVLGFIDCAEMRRVFPAAAFAPEKRR